VRCRLATLDPAHVHGAGLEGDRRPLQLAQFGHPQAVAEADQDHRRVALATRVAHARSHILEMDDSQQQPAFFVRPMPYLTAERAPPTYIFAGRVSLSQCRPCQRASVPTPTKLRPASSLQSIRPWPALPNHQETSSRSGGNISATSAHGLRDIRNSSASLSATGQPTSLPRRVDCSARWKRPSPGCRPTSAEDATPRCSRPRSCSQARARDSNLASTWQRPVARLHPVTVCARGKMLEATEGEEEVREPSRGSLYRASPP
jgi:hypothetical protein